MHQDATRVAVHSLYITLVVSTIKKEEKKTLPRRVLTHLESPSHSFGWRFDVSRCRGAVVVVEEVAVV